MALKSMSPAVAERLDCLTEELGESVHMLGKAKRHGLNSTHTDYLGIPNKELLETELGHVLARIKLLTVSGDLHWVNILRAAREKLSQEPHHLHHQNPDALRSLASGVDMRLP
jgi:NTP pyrophosphatase (non-canonical NTP hydrolase)